MRSLSVLLLLALASCGAIVALQDGEFTRDDIPYLASGLRDATDIAVAADPGLEGSPYVEMIEGVADRWDGYYDNGYEITYQLMLQEADQLSKNLEAVLATETDPARAKRVRRIVSILLRNLSLVVPPGTQPVPAGGA